MRTAILNIGQLITMAGPPRLRIGPEMEDLGLIHDAGILVESGRVTAVGESRVIEGLTDSETRIVDAAGKLVSPGIVDAHTHAVFVGNRANEFDLRSKGASYQEIRAAGGGIQSSVNGVRNATADQLLAETQRHLSWMLECGNTTVEIKSGYGLNAASELAMLQAAYQAGPQRIVSTFLGAHSIPAGMSRQTYLHEVINMLPAVEPLATYCDIFVEQGYFEPEDALKLFSATKLIPRMHADQFGDNGGAKLAATLRCRTADHLEHTGLGGIRAMKDGNVVPVLLPTSVLCLGLDKYAEARTMIDEGLPVVLASDFNPGTSPCPSMPVVMNLACTQMKMTPAEAWTASTINAAHALGLGQEVGSLERGKCADVVIHDAEDYREVPYWFGRNTVSEVLIAGERIFSKEKAPGKAGA
ncbi:MAG TPA: imidazolonepropionase [Fimbriimonadaceae bacterium]|nr:imidazolonepropionase [Fimbriimonadaceae bacterium]